MRNGKMGSFIAHFDLPAITTCPGRSEVCERLCYATHGRFVTTLVKDRLDWCYRQSLEPDFAARMAEEIRSTGVIVCRIHVSGDFYSPGYARKWQEVVAACPSVRFYFYTRSWRVGPIEPVLRQLAARENVRAWWSCDAETGEPEATPPGVRLAFMQHAAEAKPERAELVFRTRGMRKEPKVGLPMVCPQETDKTVTCGSCTVCWT